MSRTPDVPADDTAADRHPAGRSRRRLAVAAAVGATGLLLTGTGVYAALSATAFNTTAQAVSSGTLKLEMTPNGVGFTQAVSNLAPADVVNRYVTLTNSGTLAGSGLTLAVADGTATPTRLTTDATNGLRVTVTACPSAWAVSASANTGTCSGTTSTVLPQTALSTLRAGAVALTPGALAPGAVQHLQVSLTLPDQNEVTQNGVLPTAGPGTIQGLTAALTWTFTEQQRAATTTSS